MKEGREEVAVKTPQLVDGGRGDERQETGSDVISGDTVDDHVKDGGQIAR